MIRRICLGAGWLALVLIAYATLSPIENRPVVAGLRVEHFGAFALLGFVFSLGYPTRAGLVTAIVIGSAFMLEAMQLMTSDRHGRVLDAMVKAAGGFSGIAAGYFAVFLLQGPARRIKGLLGLGPSA